MYIGSNFNGTFASFAFLTTIAWTAPHHSESAIVDRNSCCYSVIKHIDFCEGVLCSPWKVLISIVISLRVSLSDFCIEKLALNVFTFSIKKS